MSIYSQTELMALGFACVGKNVSISKKASLYGISRISIGDNVRIDDFCVLSAGEGGIEIGDYIHIAVYSSIIGAAKVILADYCNISSRVSIYSSNDDYSGEFMSNPMINEQYTNVTHAPVTINKHVIVGSGAVVLPGVTLAQGCVIGALSLVNRSAEAFGIYAGQPAKFIKSRKKNLLLIEKKMVNNLRSV
ncbi:acyltransferase [Pseudoalteromonas denitrificans]|uniref:Galactoside O-acetyltransferase n=1 Tax=Pseudoalteromonas denitrificans DSM 6059 TaxID=1123010 RepID=A0A1I1JW60_9GAMM|nr:acyltransferase [Pseudoalteromonas denitrificans]SFC52212.1 galactoside O-acetyltransferase [Pseudoalteromonas denitrificans DSM 6059]